MRRHGGWFNVQVRNNMVRTFGLIVCLFVGSGCLTIKLKRTVELDRTDWHMEGASALRSSEAYSRVDPPLIEYWRYDAGAGVGAGGALIADSMVFFGSRKGLVHVLDLADGSRLGRKNVGAPVEGAMALGGERLFVALGLDDKSVIAINIVTGSKEWVKKGEPIEAGLLLVGSTLYAVDVDSRVFALDAENGNVLWEQSLGDHQTVVASPLRVGEILVVAREDGVVFGLDLDNGVQVWKTDIGAPVYNTPAANEGLVFLPTTRGVVHAIDAGTGRREWTYSVPDESMRFSAPAVVSEHNWLIVGGTDNMVRALNGADGQLIWEADVEAATNTAPLVTQNTIYVGTLRSKIFGIDKTTGTLIWSHETTGRVKSAIAAYDGMLVVMAETQQVFALAPDTTTTAENR